ncbi:MAG: hypothetical protein GEU81_05330 [Nitriliruptorales bacterium]|nr:hypothetical protein [Nitriliruptorales bacterium]
MGVLLTRRQLRQHRTGQAHHRERHVSPGSVLAMAVSVALLGTLAVRGRTALGLRRPGVRWVGATVDALPVVSAVAVLGGGLLLAVVSLLRVLKL